MLFCLQLQARLYQQAILWDIQEYDSFFMVPLDFCTESRKSCKNTVTVCKIKLI